MLDTRGLWLETMLRIAAPVLDALEKQRLRDTLPLQMNPARAPYAPLEAFGRTLCGIAPWLELEGARGREKTLQATYRRKVIDCLDAATDPGSKDQMIFMGSHYGQPLVDAAFLCYGLLRAPQSLAAALPSRVRKNLINALKETRFIQPHQNNWLLFGAMVETGLSVLNEKDIAHERVLTAIERFKGWYKGDGLYGDGENLSLDYYNSYVIHPMLLDVLKHFSGTMPECEALLSEAVRRAARCSAVLERLISPEGTYPVIGRSATFRFGAFHLLAQAALQGFLPETVSPEQVRCALTRVIDRVMSGRIFDSRGFLLPGVYGYQPSLAENYITVGSLYLCLTVFLPLGLPAGAPFWSAPDQPWTSVRLINEEDIPADHTIDS